MILVSIGLFVVVLLCVVNVIKVTKKSWIAVWTAIVPHCYLIIVYVFKTSSNMFVNTVFSSFLLLLAAFLIIKFNLVPMSDKKTQDKRLNALMGGRKLLLTCIYVTIVQTLFFVFAFKYVEILNFELHFLITDLIITGSFVVLLFLNGYFRIVILSRRLNIIKRVVFILLMWIPVINFIIILMMCHAASVEYDHELYKISQNQWRIESLICKTKYPLIMLHGVGFRDLKYLNYWGRIPKELVRNGATVYYGNQEAWGTIEANAKDIQKKILEMVKKANVEKVNIIAHSKGGLDARYMISKLGMEDYVASLTTISTPHKGSFIMDFANKMPDKLVNFIGKIINKYFKAIGDMDPDFATASKQFLTENTQKFNDEVKDSEKVFYQSYTTVMSHAYSDYILFIPFLIGRSSKEENDGLVSPSSAKWGEFKGVIRTKTFRGISHGDIIDLRRNDYKGFDVREFYVRMVSELKNKGF